MGLKDAIFLFVPAAVTLHRHHLSPSSFSSRSSRISAVVMATTVQPAVQPVVMVGGGRVGQALLSMGPSSDGDLLLRRGEALPPFAAAGPILVCTRNDDVDGVLDSTPKSRWQDLVFCQNGMLDPWLESKGLAGANQVLAYFAISKLGEPPVDWTGLSLTR